MNESEELESPVAGPGSEMPLGNVILLSLAFTVSNVNVDGHIYELI